MARAKGTGSIYKRASDGLYVGVLELPDTGTGRRRKTVSGKTRTVVMDKMRQQRQRLAEVGDIPTGSPTVRAWMDRWLPDIAAKRLKPRTLATYRTYTDNYIVPCLGRYRLDKLTPQHIIRLHASITEEKGLSGSTARQAHWILTRALRDAKRMRLVSEVVTEDVDTPRSRPTVRPSLTATQGQELLLTAAGTADLAARWAVALLGGLRQGERLGLTRESINLDTDTITVSWQLQRIPWRHGCGPAASHQWSCGYVRAGSCPDRRMEFATDQEIIPVHGGLCLLRPKSRAGWREVPMAPVLREVLVRYMDENPPGDEGLVFHGPDGHPLDPRRDYQDWLDSLALANLPRVPLHSARHTCATLLRELGVDEQTRMQILGHSSATVTAGYTHISTQATRDAMDKLGGLLDWR